jgi:hypothetical protein
MSAPRIGDTERLIRSRTTAKPPQQGWSGYRTTALAVVVALGVALVLAVTGQHGRRVVELPAAAVDIVRMLLVTAILSFLAITAYEKIAPEWAARFAASRIGNRDSEDRIDDLRQQIDEANASAVRTELWADQCNDRLRRLEAVMEGLRDEVREYGADKRQDGIESTLRGERTTQAGVKPYLLPSPRRETNERINGG